MFHTVVLGQRDLGLETWWEDGGKDDTLPNQLIRISPSQQLRQILMSNPTRPTLCLIVVMELVLLATRLERSKDSTDAHKIIRRPMTTYYLIVAVKPNNPPSTWRCECSPIGGLHSAEKHLAHRCPEAQRAYSRRQLVSPAKSSRIHVFAVAQLHIISQCRHAAYALPDRKFREMKPIRCK
jgi:hypothetical protein